VSTTDLVNGDVVGLFHPIEQKWIDHFVLDNIGFCRGVTPTGRVTVEALQMNDPLPRTAREIQLRLGLLIASTR
jgi:hypothetical protein